MTLPMPIRGLRHGALRVPARPETLGLVRARSEPTIGPLTIR